MINIVLSFYNQLEELNLVLQGYSKQSCRDFIIIIVRDGGKQDPRDIADKYSFTKCFDVPGGDDTFRLAKSRNIGIKNSTFGYIIFSDSDCIPHKDFVKHHVDNMKEKQVLSGVRYRINKINKLDDIEKNIYQKDKRLKDERFFNMNEINEHLIICFSAYKKDLISVDGYDEEFKFWGAEERDLLYRLKHQLGCKAKPMPECIVYHIKHLNRSNNIGDIFYHNKIKKIESTSISICMPTIKSDIQDRLTELKEKSVGNYNIITKYNQNGSAAENRNACLKEANGDYIIFVDDDLYNYPYAWNEKLLLYLIQNPNVLMIGPRLLNIDGSIQHTISNCDNVEDYYVDVSVIPGACMVYKNEGRKFDEIYKKWGPEDQDLIMRMKQDNPSGKIVLCNIVKIKHKNEQKNIEFFAKENRDIFIKKWGTIYE